MAEATAAIVNKPAWVDLSSTDAEAPKNPIDPSSRSYDIGVRR